MSHLSKIKTKVLNAPTLTKTLDKLGINWEYLDKNQTNLHPAIKLWSGNGELEYSAEMRWSQQSYDLSADSNTWQGKRLLDAIAEKIQQQYAYNIILEEGAKQGFSNIENDILQDGSLRLVLEKWNM
uniref:Uncharacterized protein ycf35 n=1 Tax=Palmaria palmata TaxID=2822 RepID=A0A455TPL5_PALPL|nr:Conserved hypothetical plastid protein [Palmaria palmata]